MTIATINPTTGETVRVYQPISADEIEHRLEQAMHGFAIWRGTLLTERCQVLQAAATLLEAEAGDLAALLTLEMGKTLASARAEVYKCAHAFGYYARHAGAFLADEPANAEAVGAKRAFTRCEPLGPVLAVMPWNFPLWQVTRFAAPNLAAGNVGLLKHASNVPQTALALEEILLRAGAPAGVFQTLLVESGSIRGILADPRVRAATVTGSNAAGASVAAIAGEHTKRTVLELGGSDPFIVMPSADMAAAVPIAVRARCQNNGQSCIAAKRFIVHASIGEDFEEAFVAAMSAQRVGDPMQPSTDIGPLATEQGLATLEAQVADALDHGAQLLCGGHRPSGPGWFYPPTVITGVTPQMRIFAEEVFGPVAQVVRAGSLDDAIALANASPFGLGSNLWTRDPAEQDRGIRDLEAGMVFVNGMTTSYPELSFGGVKESGYGRELGEQGAREFCNRKAVWVN